MGLFSFLGGEKQTKCDWCKEKMETPAHAKFINGKKYNFCSESCKTNFRKNYNKGRSSCPTCKLR